MNLVNIYHRSSLSKRIKRIYTKACFYIQNKLLLSAGQYKEAAEVYKKIIPRKDKLRNRELSVQLDELRTIYEVDKLTLKNEITTNRLYFFTCK